MCLQSPEPGPSPPDIQMAQVYGLLALCARAAGPCTCILLIGAVSSCRIVYNYKTSLKCHEF